MMQPVWRPLSRMLHALRCQQCRRSGEKIKHPKVPFQNDLIKHKGKNKPKPPFPPNIHRITKEKHRFAWAIKLTETPSRKKKQSLLGCPARWYHQLKKGESDMAKRAPGIFLSPTAKVLLSSERKHMALVSLLPVSHPTQMFCIQRRGDPSKSVANVGFHRHWHLGVMLQGQS